MPASEMCDGEMSRLPDSSRVKRGSWTEPLARTRSPGGGGGQGRGGLEVLSSQKNSFFKTFSHAGADEMPLALVCSGWDK